MKLKYYLRGLGIGIVVTAIIMGVALGGTTKETLSDEEIKQRAVEMGMIEGKYLSDIQNLTSTSEEHSTTEESSTEESSTEESSTEESSTEESSTEEPSTEEPSTEEPSTEEPSTEEPSTEEPSSEDPSIEEPSAEDGDLVSIVIARGDSSWSVSKDLEAAGLVADAKAYDEYLCGNGYDKSLHIGSYMIAKGSSNEEIAKIITKKK